MPEVRSQKLEVRRYRLPFYYLLFITLYCLSLSSFSYSQQTEKTFYDSDKKIKKEIFHTKKNSGKDIKDGLYQIYYQNGKMWQEGNYKNDKLTGEWKTYHPNGKIKQELIYLDGLRQGNSKIYYEDGSLYQELF